MIIGLIYSFDGRFFCVFCCFLYNFVLLFVDKNYIDGFLVSFGFKMDVDYILVM